MFADDLDRLSALHSNGKLSDEEFARAKSRVLGDDKPEPVTRRLMEMYAASVS